MQGTMEKIKDKMINERNYGKDLGQNLNGTRESNCRR